MPVRGSGAGRPDSFPVELKRDAVCPTVMRSASVDLGKLPVVLARDAGCSVGITIPTAHGKGGLDAVRPRGPPFLPSQSLFDTTANGFGQGDPQATRPPAELPMLLI
jgi:hypothetical protein